MKNLTKKWWFWLIVAIVIIGLLGGSGSNDKKAEESTKSDVDMAKQVQETWLKGLGYSSLSDVHSDPDDLLISPVNEITSFENTPSGVQVNVQDKMTAQEAKMVGQNVFACEIKDLSIIYVHGIDNSLNWVTREELCKD